MNENRLVNVVELNCGRESDLNPRVVQSLTLRRSFDPATGDFRPLVHPLVQIFDPFGEISFHSQSPQRFVTFSNGIYPITNPEALQVFSP
jgi:hypothetical protein